MSIFTLIKIGDIQYLNYHKVVNSTMSKGQLILKCPFGVLKSSKKKHWIFSRISALASKQRSNQKNKGTLYH